MTVFRLTSADFHFLPPPMCLWVEPAGREWKSADVEQKTVTLIYPYPYLRTGGESCSFHSLLFALSEWKWWKFYYGPSRYSHNLNWNFFKHKNFSFHFVFFHFVPSMTKIYRLSLISLLLTLLQAREAICWFWHQSSGYCDKSFWPPIHPFTMEQHLSIFIEGITEKGILISYTNLIKLKTIFTSN